MADQCGSDGLLARFAADPDGTFDLASEPYEMAPSGETLKLLETHQNVSGYNGRIGETTDRTRLSQCNVAGDVNMFMTPLGVENWIPRALTTGPKDGGNVFTPDAGGTDLPEWDGMMDRDALVYQYTKCRLNRLTLRGQIGQPVDFILNVLGVDRIPTAAGTFPDLTLPDDPPYMFEDGTLNIGGTDYKFLNFTSVIDNKLSARFQGDVKAQCIKRDAKRTVSLNLSTPFTVGVGGTATDLTALPAPPASVEVTLTFTNGTNVCTLRFPGVQFPREDPTVTSFGEIPLPFNGFARQTATEKEVLITNAF